MNQVGVPKRPEIPIAEFTGALGVEAATVIPFDPALFGAAANNGQMVGEADAKNPIAEKFDLLAQILTGKAELKAEKKSTFSLLSRFRRKTG